MYGCETWTLTDRLSDNSLHGTTVVGVFLSVADVRALLTSSVFFCKTMSIAQYFFGKKLVNLKAVCC